MFNKKHSEETKRKIGLANLGKQRSKTMKETLSKLYKNKTLKEIHGEEKSLEILKKMSNATKGKNNPRWIDGRSYHKHYPYEFRKIRPEILKRDKFICKLCNEQILVQTKKRFITVHHIDYNKENNLPENLITLCTFCNSSVNKSREQWTSFFQDKMAQEVMNNGM